MALTWHDIGAAEEVPEGKSRPFSCGDVRICVINEGGCFYAVSDICTHGHAFLSEGECDVSEGTVECPLHGGLFDYRTGTPVGPPAERNAKVFQIKQELGRLLLLTELCRSPV